MPSYASPLLITGARFTARLVKNCTKSSFTYPFFTQDLQKAQRHRSRRQWTFSVSPVIRDLPLQLRNSRIIIGRLHGDVAPIHLGIRVGRHGYLTSSSTMTSYANVCKGRVDGRLQLLETRTVDRKVAVVCELWAVYVSE